MESFSKLLKSFVYSFNGFREVVKERNFKIHLFFAILVLLLGYTLKISNVEFLIILLTITFVLVAEVINTVLERICDIIRDTLNLDFEATKIPRDISAFAVLITAISAVIIGLIIFLPKLLELIF